MSNQGSPGVKLGHQFSITVWSSTSPFIPLQLDVLPEIVEAVGGRAEVYLDGGVRRGTDVLKALALGAKAVFLGRPVLWGLAYEVRLPGPQESKILNEI